MAVGDRVTSALAWVYYELHKEGLTLVCVEFHRTQKVPSRPSDESVTVRENHFPPGHEAEAPSMYLCKFEIIC